jgi:RNA polymerase sigma-70 factor (ECF subfamily)
MAPQNRERATLVSGDRETPHRFFPSTRWTLIARAGALDVAGRREALGQLLATYLPTLKAHLLQKQKSNPDRVEDLLQGFVASKVLEQQLIAQADQQRGKFRTFLLVALNNYVISEARREGAQKRAPGRRRDVQAHLDVASAQAGASEAFDVEWGRQILRRVLAEMRAECESSGRTDIWGVFDSRIVQPILARTKPLPYEALVQRFNLQSPMQASNMLITGKRMFARILRAVVSEYAEDDEIEDEIEELRQIFSQARA